MKNDQCFVEEKNRTIIRQVVGYDRFVGEHALRQLEELYRALRLYVNCFQPSMKLVAKQRNGKKISSCSRTLTAPLAHAQENTSEHPFLAQSNTKKKSPLWINIVQRREKMQIR